MLSWSQKNKVTQLEKILNYDVQKCLNTKKQKHEIILAESSQSTPSELRPCVSRSEINNNTVIAKTKNQNMS